MHTDIQIRRFKSHGFLALLAVLAMSGCSTNPATGDRQFTALMSPQQEVKVGASEHEKIVQQFGLVQDPALQSYVDQIGARLAKNTERPEVQYKFFVIDSPIVNAFALPGGYVYVSRGLLALANTEAEVAGVIGHEIAHVTARHSAERYSTSVVTSLGAAVIAAAVDSSGVSQALGLGSNLYLSSYSRGQENEADTLGIRYMSRGGYDTKAMSSFLNTLQNDSALQGRLAGKSGSSEFSYFSTHPATADRVSKTMAEVGQYPQQNARVGRDAHLNVVSGMIYGDSAAQGFARGENFYHPGMGFTFSVPQGFQLINQSSQVVAASSSGAVIVFDMVGGQARDPLTYLRQVWMKDNANLQGGERIEINGLPAATGSFAGKVNGRAVTIRLVTIAWNDKIVRFQYAIPNGASAAAIDDLKRSSYSFRKMTTAEKSTIKPYRIKVVTASAGDNVSSLARRQPFEQLNEERFRVLNGLRSSEGVVAGQSYKIVVE